MSSVKPVANQDDSDLKKIMELVSRNYKSFIICITIALAAAFLMNRFMIPEYKISASLLIKEDTKAKGANVNEFINSNLFGVNQNFQNELWTLKSTPVIEQTVKNLDLSVSYFIKKGWQHQDAYNRIPFRVVLLKNHIQPINVRFRVMILDKKSYQIEVEGKDVVFYNLEKESAVSRVEKWDYTTTADFGKLVETPEMAFVIQLSPTQKTFVINDYIYSFMLHDVNSMANRLNSQLEFTIVDKNATVIEITMKNSSPEKGNDIVNELMNVYSQQNLDRKNHIANITIDYIEKQLGEISDSLNLTESNLQQYRSSNQLLNITEQASGISAQYMDLQNQLAELVTRKRYYDYVADYLVKNEDFSNITVPSSIGISDPLLNGLMSTLITAQAQRSNLIQNKQERNPLVPKLTIQIENTRKTITENISSVQKTTDIAIDEMNKRIRRVESEISRLPKTQRQLGGIERKYRLNDAIYNYLLEKRAEAKITQASNMPDNLIIEPARMVGSGPISPNARMNYLVGLFLGLAVPFGFLTAKSLLNNKIESQESIEQLTDVPVLGKIMHNFHKSVNIMHEHSKSPLAESFRALRTNIEVIFRKTPHKVILVTSSIEGEGKTFTALNLAMSYAQLGRRTLLIDFDLRKPVVYFMKSKEVREGLSSWYNEQASLEEIIASSPHEKLDFIQSGNLPPNPLELLSTEKTRELINMLKNEYDTIILDTTPLAQVSDAYLLMDVSDVNLLIVRYNYSRKKILSFILKDLKSKQVNNTCLVLNDNRVYSDQYGYGYGYNKTKKK
jgi:capsular exopolysaccharide synthesis family protein